MVHTTGTGVHCLTCSKGGRVMIISMFIVIVVGFGLLRWLEELTNEQRNRRINTYLEED